MSKFDEFLDDQITTAENWESHYASTQLHAIKAHINKLEREAEERNDDAAIGKLVREQTNLAIDMARVKALQTLDYTSNSTYREIHEWARRLHEALQNAKGGER